MPNKPAQSKKMKTMKKSLLLLLFIISSASFIAQDGISGKEPRGRKESFLKPQTNPGGVRSSSIYPVAGYKDPSWEYVILEFFSSDNYLVAIEQNGDCLYYDYITLLQDNNMERILIPLDSFSKGSYTMTVLNLNSGESVSGNFDIQ